MDRLPFVLWLLGWPLACDVSDYLTRSFPSRRLVVLFWILEHTLWAAIAILLWNNP